MASIFQRAANLARANLSSAAERGLRRLGEQATRRMTDAGSRGGTDRRSRSSGAFPGLGARVDAARGGRQNPVDAGPATIRTVEVGGRPVVSQTRAWEMRRDLPRFSYAPVQDGNADPGEVAWTWVPFDDDPTRGKDRPVLVLARVDGGLLAAQLTSRDRARDSVTRDEYGRIWLDVGAGGWDRDGRPSEARLDRLWVVRPQDVRREGARLDRDAFERVTEALHHLHG